ncbi:hypothetical protein [Nocardia macrotermitis]|uniref:Uncharacterized protein n=1 Tax=Nocardia macrotermitis TaxID=2585198 RepID=A0A7K0CW66_9NOCA|nr:hypothetical protein [Nocardia macrotermitis]MQY17746.1 hypothetical protein [Nocardia macrotermitis]
MDTWTPLSVTLIACATAGFVIAALLPLLPVWRLANPAHRTPCLRGAEIRRPNRSCSTPEHPLTIPEAHLAMQLHREHSCARKRSAFETLIAAGHIRPDSSRHIDRS